MRVFFEKIFIFLHIFFIFSYILCAYFVYLCINCAYMRFYIIYIIKCINTANPYTSNHNSVPPSLLYIIELRCRVHLCVHSTPLFLRKSFVLIKIDKLLIEVCRFFGASGGELPLPQAELRQSVASTACSREPTKRCFFLPKTHKRPHPIGGAGVCGVPDWIRTNDTRRRRPVLYPAELRIHF